MTFVSLTFLLFLPVVLLLYWLAPGRRPQNALIVLASYAFYGWWDVRFCGLLALSTAIDYVLARCLAASNTAARRKLLLGASVAANLGLLGFFKYYGFFADNLALAASQLGFELSTTTLQVVLPVGISFYTFQTLSYTIDVYRRQLEPCRSFVDYAAYVSFFPQLVAGPIERGTRLVPQFQRDRRFDPASATEGCRLLLWGLFKKAAIADNLGVFVDAAFASPGEASGLTLAVATVAFAFQIYCDFSGYSDMAIGCARFFGIDLMRNFAYPYFSQSVTEFWRRWHISLSTWFRDYLYIPLGGSRRGRHRAAFNLLVTFVVSGFWHGPAWNFVVWGALNGIVLAVPVALGWGRRTGSSTEIPGGRGLFPSLEAAARMSGTFVFICFTWIFFRAPDWDSALLVLQRIATAASGASLLQIGGARALPAMALLGLLVTLEWLQRDRHDLLYLPRLPIAVRWSIYTAMLWAAILLTPPQSSPFIYFQF